MKPLLYVILKSFKNTLIELKKKPLVIVLYTFVALGFLGMVVLTFVMPVQSVSRGTSEVFSAIIGAVLLVVFYLGLEKGINSGGSFFRLSDVNLTFTAPIPSKKVLIYGFINQLIISLVFVLFISFQIPNLKNNFAIKGYGVVIIYSCIFILFAAIQLSGILLYSLASRIAAFRIWSKKVLNVLLFLFLAGFVIHLFQVKDVIKASVIYLNSAFFDYIPLIGWFRVVLTASVKGITFDFWLNLILIILALAAMVYILYKVNTDYYEDVLAATEKKEELIKLKKEGGVRSGFQNSKLRRVSQKNMGAGVSAVFFRQILELRKTGFLFLNKNSLFIIVFGIASKFLFPHADIKAVLYFSVYVLFFFSIQGKWAQELGKPYIYLIPASSASKVFYATLSDNIKNAVDGLLLFIAGGLMFNSDPVAVVLYAAAFTSFGAIYVYGDVLSQRLLGAVHSKNLAIFVKMFLAFAVILPGLVVSIALGVVFEAVPFIDYYTVVILIVYNLLASGLIILFSHWIFDYIEMR